MLAAQVIPKQRVVALSIKLLKTFFDGYHNLKTSGPEPKWNIEDMVVTWDGYQGSSFVVLKDNGDEDLIYLNRLELLAWASSATEQPVSYLLREIEGSQSPLEKLARCAE